MRFILAIFRPPFYALVIRCFTIFSRPYGLLEVSSWYQLLSNVLLGGMIYQNSMAQIPKTFLSLFDFHPRSVLIVSVVWQAPLVPMDHHVDPPRDFMLILMMSLSPFMLHSPSRLPVYVVRSTSLVPANDRVDQSIGITPVVIRSPWPFALRLLCVLDVSAVWPASLVLAGHRED